MQFTLLTFVTVGFVARNLRRTCCELNQVFGFALELEIAVVECRPVIKDEQTAAPPPVDVEIRCGRLPLRPPRHVDGDEAVRRNAGIRIDIDVVIVGDSMTAA